MPEVERINGEPVELVTDFGALRVGDIVYVVRCCTADQRHRMVLIAKSDQPGMSTHAFGEVGWWIGLPIPSCAKGATVAGVGRGTVARGRVYRVINPPLASDDAEENRALDTQRVRRKVGAR